MELETGSENALHFECEKQVLEKRIELLSAEIQGNNQKIQWAKKKIRSLEEQGKAVSAQLSDVANMDGRLWQKPPVGTIVPFLPLKDRKAPVLSLFNFKGGVGKTTIAANLAGSLSERGLNVLLVDLDYQGNLTKLCLDESHREDIQRAQRFIHNIFQPRVSLIEEFQRNITHIGSSSCHIVCANNQLNAVEMQVMARWVVDARQEARYYFRQIFHSTQIQTNYDIVILDCPPRLTTACINALTSSDFLIIPVKLSPLDVAPVPELLDSLKVLRTAGVCPDLDILGILANDTSSRNQGLIAREDRIWKDLPQKCRDKWHRDVNHFATTIPRSGKFTEAASAHRFATSSAELKSVFLDLVHEIEQTVPLYEARRVAVAR